MCAQVGRPQEHSHEDDPNERRIMRESLAEVWAKLRQEHDELRVKMHLGTMEAKEEWDELEKKWQRFESKAAEAKDQVVETSREVSEGVELIAKELGAAYHRIRDGLRES